jgi:CMP-N-acetylneuraminic acid synthetase
MRNGKTIVGVIPARLGSKRVKAKNLRVLGGKPLIYYAIQAVKGAKSFDAVYVNSESDLIGEVAARYEIGFHKRPAELATSDSMIDEYINEFLTNVPCDVLAVVNPTSPFLTSADIDAAIDYFLAQPIDTLLACENVRTHCFLHGEAVNFSTSGQHPRSQDIPPVQALNFAVTVWDAKKFLDQYARKGYAVYTGRLGFFAFEGLAAIDIDWEDDFVLAEIVMENLGRFHNPSVRHDPVLDALLAGGEVTET